MASLDDKMYELLQQVRNGLNDAVGFASQVDEYKRYEAALKEVKVTEKKLRAVQSHIRSHMRRTKDAFQAACPHTNKVDTRIRHDGEGRRIVEFQACTNCSKTFDLRAE